MKRIDRLDLKELIHLLDQRNADILQYLSPSVESALRERFKRMKDEEWRESRLWPQRIVVGIIWRVRGFKKEPYLWSDLYSNASRGFLYEMTLDFIVQASGITFGTEPCNRTAAVIKEMRRTAQVIANVPKALDGFFVFAPEIYKEVARASSNWETMFICLQTMIGDLPKEHRFYWV